jgi:hypothetical protein
MGRSCYLTAATTCAQLGVGFAVIAVNKVQEQSDAHDEEREDADEQT